MQWIAKGKHTLWTHWVYALMETEQKEKAKEKLGHWPLGPHMCYKSSLGQERGQFL